ncbi:glycosyltransferase family 2 protein [Clostridium neonatale]|uniref:glycosyltransferase family 2 protein n=1 Tax=Clostridium neonatale TaxID=137838 RepID=UPI003D358ED8
MCKISIITPVYKVEKYLKKCIDSILNQTLTDFELFIVDDGSPDNCGKIMDEYAKNDSRVKVIHKKNGGAPSARNAGIKCASGKYMYFPDSDDWLERDYLEKLYNIAEKYSAQLVISGFTMEYFENGKEQSYKVSVPDDIYENQDMVRDNLHNYFNNMMMAVPWNKLYRTDYIIEKGILFPNLKWDDLHFNMEIIKDISSVAISKNSGYHFFRSREGSETTTVFDGLLYEKRREQFEHIMDIYKYWGKERDDDILSKLYGYYASRLVQCIQEISISNKSNKEKRKLINEIINDKFNYRAIKYGEIDSKLLKIAVLPARIKNVTLCIIVGKGIGFVKVNMSELFYRLKSIEVNKAV